MKGRAIWAPTHPTQVDRSFPLSAGAILFCGSKTHLKHRQLMFPGRAAGEVVRALAWLGPEKAGEAIRKLRAKLPSSELKEVTSARSRLPTWMAREVSALMDRG